MEKEMYLTLSQNLRSSMIFLNVLGLTLEEKNNITDKTKLKIFDSENKIVGKISFDNNQTIIEAKTNFGLLKASYPLAILDGFVEEDLDNYTFLDWKNNIKYEITKNETIKLTGEFLIKSSIDSDGNLKCTSHPSLELKASNKTLLTLKMMRERKMFSLTTDEIDSKEEILIMPNNIKDGYIIHNLTKGKYDKKKGYPFKKHASITDKGDNLKAFTYIDEYTNRLAKLDTNYKKNGKDDSKELLIQKGELMQKIDKDMYDKIQEIIEDFNIKGISLINNLISITFYSYTNRELKALLGIEKTEIKFQNNSTNLLNAYFDKQNDLTKHIENKKRSK